MISYKGYYIKKNPLFPNLLSVVTEGRGGKIPDILNTQFTTPTYAQQAIDLYLNSKIKKEEKSGNKESATSGN